MPEPREVIAGAIEAADGQPIEEGYAADLADSISDWSAFLADAVISALRSAPEATRMALIRELLPATCALVSVEPTEEMFRAGMMRSLETGSISKTWRAMVKAATQKDQQS